MHVLIPDVMLSDLLAVLFAVNKAVGTQPWSVALTCCRVTLTHQGCFGGACIELLDPASRVLPSFCAKIILTAEIFDIMLTAYRFSVLFWKETLKKV